MRTCIAAIVLFMSVTAITESAMGRRLWGVGGKPGLWSGDIWSEHNSQFVADPYSLTHVTHGVLFYGATRLLMGAAPLSVRLITAIGLESIWEVMENSDTVINRYRQETISLNYYGDSIVNSLSDILACTIGFLLAARLPKRVTIAGTVILEIVLAFWIRDNLTINIVMLIAPVRALRNWQLGH